MRYDKLIKCAAFFQNYDFFNHMYFDHLSSVVDGGYSNWTLSIPCDVSCGDGVEVWRRTCSSPAPKYNGRNCSGLGISTEFRNCSKTPCPSKAELTITFIHSTGGNSLQLP